MEPPELPDEGPTQPAAPDPAAGPSVRPRRRRWRRLLVGLGVGAAGLVGLVGVGAVGTWAVLMTDWGQEWLRGQVEGLASGAMTEGQTTIGDLETDLLSYVRVSDVRIDDVDGREVVGVDSAVAQLRLLDLLRGVVRVTSVRVDGVRGDLQIADDGTIDISRLYTPTTPPDPNLPPWEGLPVDIVVDEIIVEGVQAALTGGGLDVQTRDVGLTALFEASGKRFTVSQIDLAGTLAAPRDGPLAVSGDFVWDDTGVDSTALRVQLPDSIATVSGHARDLYGTGDVSARLTVEPLDLADVDAFAKAGLAGRLGGALDVQGPLDALAITGALLGQDGTEGSVTVDVVVDAAKPAYAGTVVADALRLDHLIPTIGTELPVSGRLIVDGSGSAWPDGIEIGGRVEEGRLSILGLDVDRLSTQVALAKGVLTLREAEAVGAPGVVQGGGTIDLQSGRMDLDLDLSGIDTSALRMFYVPAELDGTRASGTAHVGMDLFDPVVEVAVDGQLVAAPLRWTRDVVARRATARYRVLVVDTDVDVTGDIFADDVVAYGAIVPSAASRGVAVRVRDDAVSVRGGIEAEGAVYPLVPDSLVADLGRGVSAATAAGSFTVDVPLDPVGDVSVHVEADVGPHRLLRYPGRSGRVTFDLTGNDAAITAQLDAGPTRRLAEVDGGFDLETLTFAFDTLQVAPVSTQTWTQTEPTRFVVDGLGVRDLSARLVSSRGTIAASGIVGLEGDQDLHLEVEAFELRALSELLPMWVDGLDGYAAGIVDLEGTAESPVVVGAVDAEDVYFIQRDDSGTEVETVRNLGLRLALQGHDGQFAIRGRTNVQGVPLADIDLTVPFDLAFERAGLVPDGPLDGHITVLPASLDRISAVSALAPELVGDVSAHLRVRGTPLDPELHLSGVAELPTEGLDDRLRVELHGSRVGRDVGATADIRSGLELLASARLGAETDINSVLAWSLLPDQVEPNWDSEATLLSDLVGGVELAGLPVGRVADLAGVQLDVAGDVYGQVAIAGSLLRPRPTVRARLENGRAGPVLVDDLLLIAAPGDDGYTVGVQADLREATRGNSKQVDVGSVYVAGVVPLVVDLGAESWTDWIVGELDVSVDVDVPLSAVAAYDTGLRQADGSLEVDGFLTGSPVDPDVSLNAAVSPGSTFVYAPLGVRYSDVELDLSADRDAIRFTHVKATTDPVRRGPGLKLLGEGVDLLGSDVGGESTMEASGTASLEEWRVTDLNLSTSLKRAMLVSAPDQVIRASTVTPLTVTGDLAFPRVRGEIRIDKAEIFLDYATAVGGGTMRLDPRVAVHRDGVVGTAAKAEASLLDDVDVDVIVDVGRSARGRLTMPLESLQFMGGLAAAVTKIDLRARLSGDARYRQLPCRRRDAEGKARPIPSRVGKCGLYHPQMEGSIGIVDGTAKVFASEFILTDSSVNFVGNEIYNPNLNINGRMEAQDATIDMNITGTAYEPVPSFTSADTDQVFLTLLTGRNPDEIDYDELVGVLAQAALQSLLSGVNLGTFNIDAAGKVVWGTTVSRDLYLQATAGGVPRTDENSFEFELEYTLIDGVLTRVGVGGYAIPFWMDLLLERKFD